MNSKKILSIVMILIMLTGILPINVGASSKCDVADGIIDITDRTVYERRGLGAAKAVNIAVNGADVESAAEDGTTIDIVLSENTAPDASISIEFGTTLDRNMSMSGHKTTVNLTDGCASFEMTLKGQYSSLSSLSGTVNYLLRITSAEAPTTVPERIVESDSKSTYTGVSLDINLSDYFKNANKYYLVGDDDKVLTDGRIYTFKTFSGNTHTLVFAASNDIGECPDYVTITVKVTEIQSGAWLGITTSNGSVNYVKFTDADGNNIDGLRASFEDKSIMVSLPRTFESNGKITATFDLTQNNGLPKLSTSNAFNGSNDTKLFTTTLSDGMGSRTMYLYNAHPKATSNNYTTYTVSYAVENEIPHLAEEQEKSVEAEIVAGESYKLNLAPIFTDADGDELSYIVMVNGEATPVADANYSFTPTLGGTYELEFFASDFMATSADSYRVTLTVSNSAETYDMSLLLPDDINPEFHITNGYDENGTDITGDTLTSVKGESTEGYANYTVSVPINITMISVRDEVYGGMAISASVDGITKLCKIQTQITDFSDKVIPGSVVVSYGDYKAVGVDGKFLLMPETEYTFSVTPEDTSTYNAGSEALSIIENTDKVSVKVSYKNPKTIITTTGATAKLFKYSNNYFVHTVYEPLVTVDNENGTSTHYFAAEGDLSYRVSMDGMLTKAGYIKRGNSVTVLHEENDRHPADRVDYFTETSNASTVGDDSVLLNINGQNHLSLEHGEAKTVKAYRAWQIIDLTYNNHIIEPDFHFNVLSGDDVVSFEPVENQPATNGSGNWQKLTAIGKGTAVVEVTYDAVNITGSSFDGFYGASDTARSGLFVVTVGENVPDVDFGIEGKSGAGSMVYNEANKKAWDSEFDTLYFIGESGEIRLSPVLTEGIITEVAVSGDKGESYTVLEEADGVYTAPIASGNNIIRITTDKGTAYQVVRGKKIELSVKNITNPGKAIEFGDEVSITFMGVHTPIPKVAGTYNPGYKNNTNGDGGVHLCYSYGNERLTSDGKQYTFSADGTTVKLKLAQDCEETQFKLTDGYIALGVIGVSDFADGGNSHRNIPDIGGTTRGSETTFHTRSILPDITINIGMLPSGNTAPIIRENAPETASLSLGGTYAISMSKIFADHDNDALTYTAKVNDSEEIIVEDAYYAFTPDSAGTYIITFVAKDSETQSDTHTLTLTVKEKQSSTGGSSLTEWDIPYDEIKGYVNISFTDNGKRVQGESNVAYPKALGTIISSTRAPFTDGDTIADVTLRLLDNLGYTYQHTGTTKKGFYLGSIGGFTHKGISYDSFGEFDAGSGSGWMITYNKKFIECGASDFEVKNGDTIKWQYTCQLGKDIGDTYYSGASASKGNKVNIKKEEEIKLEAEEKSPKSFNEDTFADVTKDDWCYEYVKYVYENKLMEGTDKGFEPDKKMSRAMLVTVIYRMENPLPHDGEMPFGDVDRDKWYYDAVSWAFENGIVQGISKSEFAPNDEVTREQTALIMYRYAKLCGYDISADFDISHFTDAEDVSSWAMDAVRWATKTGLITGTEHSVMLPQAQAKRSQIAAIITRFCLFKEE